jgi:tetratricopeptide (TPR) repeat protein
MASGDSQFADSVAVQVDAELRRLKEEGLPNMPVAIPTDEIDFQRLRCFVDGHEQAERVAEAWRADLVIWGRAYCNTNVELHHTVNIRQKIKVDGPIQASDHSTVSVGSIVVPTPKPYAVCPSATLHRSGSSLRRSTKAVKLESLADLNLELPTLSSTAPFQLVYFTIGLHYFEQGRPWIAARLFERSVEDVLSPKDENLATLHQYLGHAYLELPGGAERSIEFSKKALKSVEGTGTAVEGALLNNIGAALGAQGRAGEALEYYGRALAITEKALGKDHPVVAERLNNIGYALQAAGKAGEALKHFGHALEITEKALGKEHPDVSLFLSNIGYALQAAGKPGEALEYYGRALAIDEKALGKEHPSVATGLNNIGGALQDQGKVEEALKYYGPALVITEKALGKDHPSVATRLTNIGSALEAQGKSGEALEYHGRALEIDEKALGKKHPSVARDLNNIGSALLAQGKSGEALEYHGRALEIDEEALGKEHPSVARDLNNVGSALLAQGKSGEALKHYQRALEIYEKAHGEEHPNVATCLNNVGYLLEKQGKAGEASEHYRRALAIDEKALGKEHPNVARDLNNIGSALKEQRKAGEALEHYRRALAIAEKALGKEHPKTLTIAADVCRCIASASGFVSGKGGVVVIGIVPGSQAEKLGLGCGDWIAEYRGVRVRNAEHLVELVKGSTGTDRSLVVVRQRRRVRLEPAPGPLGVRFSD